MNKKLELKRDGWASKLARIQEALNNRYVVPLKSTPFDLFFARNPDMRKKSRGEAEGDEKRVDVESNAGKLRRRNEVVVEEVYLKIAEGAKRVRQEGCDRKSAAKRGLRGWLTKVSSSLRLLSPFCPRKERSSSSFHVLFGFPCGNLSISLGTLGHSLRF